MSSMIMNMMMNMNNVDHSSLPIFVFFFGVLFFPLLFFLFLVFSSFSLLSLSFAFFFSWSLSGGCWRLCVVPVVSNTTKFYAHPGARV